MELPLSLHHPAALRAPTRGGRGQELDGCRLSPPRVLSKRRAALHHKPGHKEGIVESDAGACLDLHGCTTDENDCALREKVTLATSYVWTLSIAGQMPQTMPGFRQMAP